MSRESESSAGANRLAGSSSPYLLLHQHNPVDWYPWGEEALDRARREDKPIFLSVGYSTCYWCHVMERESFSDERVAALMNRDFVNVKLDREERPDLDEIYMAATQILTGQGGWPNSVFLTPELEPFFAGTYFPPVDRPGLPAFRTVLESMARAWRLQRAEVEEQATSVGRAIRHHLGDRPPPDASPPGEETVAAAFEGLRQGFDPKWGGFGTAPKFPTPSNLLLLLELSAAEEDAASMLSTTLDRMARGGICDQLGGGFHRYATDGEWKVPHFEKMLYDNAWLLEVYAREWARSRDPQAERVVRATVAFLDRELTAPQGAFWSALDAETDGHEGAFYVWTRQELLAVLGEEDFGFLAPVLGFDGRPFFEGDSYVLHLPRRLEEQAERRRMAVDELLDELAPLFRKLLRVRAARRRPLTDDKVLTDWNGMTIAALATAGRLVGEEGFVARAAAAAEFLLAELRDTSGGLLHAWREGRAHERALLADYVFLVRGLLALRRATGKDRWLEHAVRLADEQTRLLADGEGGFHLSQAGSDLLVRSRDLFDGAVPAANGAAVLNLIELARLEPEGPWRHEAESALRAFAPIVSRVPQAARTLAVAARRWWAESGAPSPAVRREEPAAGKPEAGAGDPVTAGVDWLAAGGDGSRRFELRLRIEPGWHVYASYPRGKAPAWVSPLRLAVPDGSLDSLELPPPVELPGIAGGPELLIYEGDVRIGGRVRPGDSSARLEVSFQACDERRCRAPESRSFGFPDTDD